MLQNHTNQAWCEIHQARQQVELALLKSDELTPEIKAKLQSLEMILDFVSTVATDINILALKELGATESEEELRRIHEEQK